MKSKLVLFFVGALLVTTMHSAFAADKDKDEDSDDQDSKSDVTEILNSMGYPELQVVPRASERLKMEAKAEAGSWFVSHWPVEVSGLATLYTGISSTSNQKDDLSTKNKNDAKTIATVTEAVGVGWLAAGLLIGAQRPYYNGERSLRKFSGKDERSALLRERLAEEALEKPARTMRVLTVVSVVTNFTMSGLSAIYADDQGKMVAGVSAILAFLPLMFKDPSISIHEKHIEYKKKIYAPLKSASFRLDPESRTLTPMTNLTWNF